MRASLIVLFCALAAGADTLSLKDGRFVERDAIKKTGKGYEVVFENGTVAVPESMVLALFRAGEKPVFTPQTDLEKKKFEKGFLPWGRRWVRQSQWERLQAAEAERRARAMEQLKGRRYWRNHATVETKQFIFKHTLPDETFEEFKNLFETYYQYFTKYWRFRPSPKFEKVTINIYHEREYFEQVSGAPSGVVGYYVPHEKDLHFYYDRENHRYTIDVMFHEGNHMLTHMIDEDMWYPWWIGEGMAEYFGASSWDPEKKEMKIGLLQAGRLAVLQSQVKDEKMLKLKVLLESQGMGAVGYAWAWSFCHFLLHTPAYEKKFKKYFMAVARDGSIKRVPRFLKFKQIPGDEARESLLRYLRVKDIEKLEAEWYEYIRERLAIDRNELDWGQAGYVMMMYGEDAKARKFFKRAIDRDSKEAYVHYNYAKLKFRQNMPGIALKYATKACELDPLHASAWSIRGQALHRQGETAEGLRLLKLAREIDPENNDIWLALEMIEKASGDG